MRLIYAVAQEGVPTVLLQCHQGARRRGVQIALLHSVSNYVPSMCLPESPWYNGSFASKGGIACNIIPCTKWPPVSLHQILDLDHVPIYLYIGAALAADPDTDLLGAFSSTDTNVEPLRIRKTFYLPPPFVGIFLEW